MKIKIAVLVVVLLAVIVTAVMAQGFAVRQQWEYALVTANLTSSEYAFVTSVVYEEVGAENLNHDTTNELWGVLDAIDGAALVDYLGAMGISGFELVSVTQVGTNFVYHFKRPLET